MDSDVVNMFQVVRAGRTYTPYDKIVRASQQVPQGSLSDRNASPSGVFGGEGVGVLSGEAVDIQVYLGMLVIINVISGPTFLQVTMSLGICHQTNNPNSQMSGR